MLGFPMDTNHLIAVGVGLQLLFTAVRHFVHSPARQAQLDAIQEQVNSLVASATGKAG